MAARSRNAPRVAAMTACAASWRATISALIMLCPPFRYDVIRNRCEIGRSWQRPPGPAHLRAVLVPLSQPDGDHAVSPQLPACPLRTLYRKCSLRIEAFGLAPRAIGAALRAISAWAADRVGATVSLGWYARS